MTTIGFILGFILLLFLVIFRLISQHRVTTINRLTSQQQEVQARYDFMVSQKRELKREAVDKEQKLATLKNKSQGIKTISAEDLDFEEEDATVKVSRYLVSQGMITMEQNEQALKKMEVMKMDFLSICLTLGFIDLETSKLALKANNPK
ncbi:MULTISPECIES: hypothetical protein [unclassified Pseudodesulfovibrio]|uniref:hypothetical protein n=1 Tax=unclassified Pseudodesulfovibrio TaxID=2661612 RepID=UPI000FEBD900|nr:MULTISPECIES: hypothetical protein [unclassified Pseudodesulfovibrio]MCJ2164082.1 hypothetical protein [Pseudodesulfovibrio sp. S3-i]RWU05287.1 hypothetical protein DWB63_06435 [Pseudodesulfovibrio sp. S3]